jgi:glutathione S-transferase
MPFCPVPHTTRDQVWLALGLGLGAALGLGLASSKRSKKSLFSFSSSTSPAPPGAPPGGSRSRRTTFTYWNGRGMAEKIRLMLAATGVDYDEAVPGFPSEVTHLSEPEHLAKLRADGMLMMNQVPLLCIDGLRLVQSRAIVRYLAERGGLCGDGSARQRVECDVMAESVHDWKDATCSSFEYGMNGFEPNERQLRKIKKGNARFLPILEQRLSRDGKAHDFLVGSAMTYADVLMLEVLEQIVPADPGCLAAFPGVQRLHQRLREVPRIARWLNSDRRKTKTQAEVAPYKALVKHTCSF